MSTVTLDAAGRVLLPKKLRQEMGIEPGDELSLEAEGDRILLKPARSASLLRKKRGVWVFDSGEPVSASEVERAIDTQRQSRARSQRGT